MRKALFLGLAVAFMACGAQAAYWHSDFGEAQRKAYGENRLLLLYFTSSDRGGTCARLQDEVFSKYEFQVFADRHLVLVEVDFPRWKQLPSAQVQANRALAEKYQAQGWPHVLVLNNRGDALARMGYMEGGPQAYIRAIERFTDQSAASGPEAPLFSGAPIGPAPKYKDLTLKSISGAGTKRLALINNVTLGVGESGKVRLGEGEVKIKCEEIRDRSVIVTVDGKKGRRELALAPPPPAPAKGKSPQQAKAGAKR